MDELTPLTNATLSALPEDVRVPRYDRTRLTPGIVHIGLGNFHRAHQAWYLHRLMDEGRCHGWAIIGAGVRPYDAAMREKLISQDCLTTLIELDRDSTAFEVAGSMIDYLPVAPGHGPLIARMADPAIRIVALTVTEGGYFRIGDAFDGNHADIQADLARPDAPRTAFGAIAAALGRRRTLGHGPLTVQSCDNLQGNGDTVRDTVVSLARLIDSALADWIDAECSFPNAVVDCITPATGPKERELVHSRGIDDQVPVAHEPTRHWVIEDNFCAGRPEWERVGAILTDQVQRFAAMKLRILNAGHQLVANAGDLLGIETIAEAITHPRISAMFRKVQTEEILPQVEAVPGFTPLEYLTLIEWRFSNPRIVDTTRRVAHDGSSRHPRFVLPIVHERLAAGARIDGLALVEALWARYCLGTRENGSTITPNDPAWPALQRRAAAARDHPVEWLGPSFVYDDSIFGNASFRAAFADHLGRIHADGVEVAIQTYLDGGV